jgi:hypothetical protein
MIPSTAHTSAWRGPRVIGSAAKRSSGAGRADAPYVASPLARLSQS